MKKINIFIIIIFFLIPKSFAQENIEFNIWKDNFKKIALKNNISEKTFNMVMSNARFLPKVIEYDRYQPEFYEDTKTYISKRTSKKKIIKGLNYYSKNINLINNVEKKFEIEKEFLLALMGIETNFGTYVGKMDIISSLSTLSFDKRRSEFFTNELLTILKLVESNKIDYKTLYGSWAGAFGFFQFMPSTNTSPDEGFKRPMRISMIVVFPDPLLPINPTLSPFLIVSEKWLIDLSKVSK